MSTVKVDTLETLDGSLSADVAELINRMGEIGGTAAMRDAQMSSSDATAGRVLLVGAFGSNGGPVLEFTGDTNTLIAPADYYATSTSTNQPTSGVGYLIRVIKRASGVVLQAAVCGTPSTTPTAIQLAHRVSTDNGATWGLWIHDWNSLSVINELPITTMSAAATLNIGAALSNTLYVTGATTITAFDSVQAGAIRRILFYGVPRLTHNATTLILPGALDIITQLGDVAEFVSLGAGNWKCISFSRADGTSVIGGSAGATGGGSANYKDQIFNETDQVVMNNWTVGQGSMKSSVTITIANPAVFGFVAHGFVAGQPVRLTTTGALPTGLSSNSVYYVIATGLTADAFQVSTTQGGSGVVTTGTQSGVHSIGKIKNALITKELRVANGVSVTIPSGSSLVVVGAGGAAGVPDTVVNTFNAQNISGVKNFTSPPTLNGFDLTSIGLNQTWQDVTGSRVLGTTYTNSTGKPIAINVYSIQSAASLITATVAGVLLKGSQAVTGGGHSVFAIVPNGATYSVTVSNGTPSGLAWMELR